MSGHSKWATIKHKKGAADASLGKLFAKLIRQVEVAAREGGGDPDMNPTLRTMFQKARDASVPMDTIQKAIKRGTGDLEGVIDKLDHLVSLGVGAAGHDREGHQAGHRRARGREVRDGAVRGLRAVRRGRHR